MSVGDKDLLCAAALQMLRPGVSRCRWWVFELVLIIPTWYENKLDTELKTKKMEKKKKSVLNWHHWRHILHSPSSFLDFPDVCVYTQTHTDTHRYRKVVSNCVCRCINFSCRGWNLGWLVYLLHNTVSGLEAVGLNQRKRWNSQYMRSSTPGAARRCLRVCQPCFGWLAARHVRCDPC